MHRARRRIRRAALVHHKVFTSKSLLPSGTATWETAEIDVFGNSELLMAFTHQYAGSYVPLG